ncbi:MAG: hypothetical protein ING29_13880 [Azospirillum sp.]|nr:hypothetical protein [Azospirillum sp.]
MKPGIQPTDEAAMLGKASKSPDPTIVTAAESRELISQAKNQDLADDRCRCSACRRPSLGLATISLPSFTTIRRWSVRVAAVVAAIKVLIEDTPPIISFFVDLFAIATA